MVRLSVAGGRGAERGARRQFRRDRRTTPPTEATSFVDEGDTIDLGDRSFVALHTPGHTDGSICLWEEASGTIFTGDAIYVDARLGWEDPEAFAASLVRLRGLDIRIAHSGHGRSFDASDLRGTVDGTLAELS